MLNINHASRQFGGIKAIDNCSLTVSQGTITGLIGPNGAGKTTLFNLISRIYDLDHGSIHFMDNPIHTLPSYKVAHKKLARTFQIPQELKEMTVLENLMLVPSRQHGENLFFTIFCSGLVKKEEERILKKAEEVLEFLEIIHLKNELAKNLSVGQKKLLEIARTLMDDPSMILLDEPGAGVNPTLMKKIAASIMQLKEDGKTFFLIEHDMDLIMNLCDVVIVMNKGTTLTEGTPEEVKHNKDVLLAYLGGLEDDS